MLPRLPLTCTYVKVRIVLAEPQEVDRTAGSYRPLACVFFCLALKSAVWLFTAFYGHIFASRQFGSLADPTLLMFSIAGDN